jgi:hypothetical protein
LTDFSFNWTRWPFVEIPGDPIVLQLAGISDPLRTDLIQWCEMMLENFDEISGFRNSYAKKTMNQLYEELSERLTREGVEFTKDVWWN